jgi:hypothetical protein
MVGEQAMVVLVLGGSPLTVNSGWTISGQLSRHPLPASQTQPVNQPQACASVVIKQEFKQRVKPFHSSQRNRSSVTANSKSSANRAGGDGFAMRTGLISVLYCSRRLRSGLCGCHFADLSARMQASHVHQSFTKRPALDNQHRTRLFLRTHQQVPGRALCSLRQECAVPANQCSKC